MSIANLARMHLRTWFCPSTTATSEVTLFVSIYVSNNTTALPGELIYTTNYSALLSLSATAEYVGVPFEFGASTDNRVLSASCCYLVTLSSDVYRYAGTWLKHQIGLPLLKVGPRVPISAKSSPPWQLTHQFQCRLLESRKLMEF